MEPQVEDVRRILERTRTFASVGLSSNPDKESYQVVQYLVSQGLRVIPVNPTAPDIFGEMAYPNLTAVPEMPDVVQIFRRPEDVPPVVDEAIAKGVKVIWFQPGTTNPEAAEKARSAGIEVIEELCMRVAHRFVFGAKG